MLIRFLKTNPILIVAALLFAIEAGLILRATGGHFIYTLDDPYIHLALAENLARFGHYGINLNEYSSASSSIIWPFLLVPFFSLGIGLYGPLILNLVCAFASLIIIQMTATALARGRTPYSRYTPSAIALFIFFIANGFGVVFTGMEHSLHIFVTVLTIYAVNRLALIKRDDRSAALVAVCAVLSPLIRFEGLAIALFAIASLVLSGRLRLALISVALIVATLGLFFYGMSSLGLAWLPSSVLVKSGATAALTGEAGYHASVAAGLLLNFRENIANEEAALLLVLAVAFLLRAMVASIRGEAFARLYAGGVLGVIILHLLLGKFGFYSRWQDYIYAFALCAGLYLFSDFLFRPHTKRDFALIGSIAVMAVILSHLQSVRPVITTPLAAQNIYDQQFQMHRFATLFWKKPVAVNDIGYVSFENDQYVLDLYGLGSAEARRSLATGDHDFFNRLTSQHMVHLAMIYDVWFLGWVPSNWMPVAELDLNSRLITPADRRVSFYLVGLDRNDFSQAVRSLEEFAQTLPPRASLTLLHEKTLEDNR
jgi:hypothetical protein